MGEHVTKQKIAIRVMGECADKIMDETLVQMCRAIGGEFLGPSGEPTPHGLLKARGYYWHLTRTGQAPGTFIPLPKGRGARKFSDPDYHPLVSETKPNRVKKSSIKFEVSSSALGAVLEHASHQEGFVPSPVEVEVSSETPEIEKTSELKKTIRSGAKKTPEEISEMRKAAMTKINAARAKAKSEKIAA
jgi:hypothetical protein